MKHIVSMRFRLALAALASALPITALASIQVTSGWQLPVNGSDTGPSNAVAFDKSGNFYYEYVTANTLHLRRMSAAESFLFDVAIVKLAAPAQSYVSLTVSPPSSVGQYAYCGWNTRDANGNIVANLTKIDPNGQRPWASTFSLSNATGGDILLSVGSDTAGNTFLALAESTASDVELKLLKLSSTGAIVNQSSVPEIKPLLSSDACFDLASSSFVVAGADNITPGYARWGSYRVADGIRNFGDTFAFDAVLGNVSSHVNALPGGRYAVIRNFLPTSSGSNPAFDFTVYDGLGASQWHYPTSGTEFGSLLQVAGSSAALPVYGVGKYPSNSSTYDFVDQFTWSGMRNWRKSNMPVDTIYPTSDGFLATYQAPGTSIVFVEHADVSATFDWFKYYTLCLGARPALAAFQNAFYAYAGTAGPQVTIERFVTGLTLKSISCPTSVKAGSSFTLTITLNGAAPAGGMQVGLTSFDSHVLFQSNNSSSLWATVPAGQTTLMVPMNTLAVSGNTTVKLLGIQNGVRSNASIVLTLNGKR